MRIILIFIDGLGIGENSVLKNPCTDERIKLFNKFSSDKFPGHLLFQGMIKPLDCQLGVKGLPQSATGQTVLYTGINAAKILNRHLSGFPNQKLRDILEQSSILKRVTESGKKAAFINAYRPIFFERGPESIIRFLSVTSIMNWKAGLKFFDFDDLRRERCIYHDFTNREPIKKGFNLPEYSPEKAGQILARASRNYDFLLYEYFKTDFAGHKQNLQKATEMLFQLEKFILAVLKHTDLSETLLIVTSDHGNIEDISVKTHTKNPVPLLVWGPQKKELINTVDSIEDVTDRILYLLLPGW